MDDPRNVLQPKLVGKSFADVVKNSTDDNRSSTSLAGFSNIPLIFHNAHEDLLQGSGVNCFKSHSYRNEKPAIVLSESEVEDLAQPLKLTLIGKFTAGRPKWEVIQEVFKALKLNGIYRCVHLDVKHIILHLSNAEDYIRLFAKQSIFVKGFLLKFLKWTPDFSVNFESSFAPVWISFPLIRLHFYNRAMLFSIAAIFGTPLKLDHATANWLRPERARILVEMDLRKRFDDEIWLGSENTGYIQKVVFENLPGYCSYCHKIGHFDSTCFHLHPELKITREVKRNPGFQQSRMNKDNPIINGNQTDVTLMTKSVEVLHQTGIQITNNCIHEKQSDLVLDKSVSHLDIQKNLLLLSQITDENPVKLVTEKNTVQPSQVLFETKLAVPGIKIVDDSAVPYKHHNKDVFDDLQSVGINLAVETATDVPGIKTADDSAVIRNNNFQSPVYIPESVFEKNVSDSGFKSVDDTEFPVCIPESESVMNILDSGTVPPKLYCHKSLLE